MKTNKRAVSPAIVMIIVIAFGLVVESVLKLTVRTTHNQQDEYVWLDAKNAAEAAIEYGFAQLMDRFGKNVSIPLNSLAPTQSPLSLPTQYFTTFGKNTGAWVGSKIVLPAQATYDPTSKTQWNNRTTDLLGGVVPPGAWQYINGSTPGNEFDPLKNKLVFVRNINVYGKATATDFRNKRNVTVYAKETLQIRDAPLFANAIFYNMDMEIAPGAAMTVSGPVHTNYNAYLSSSAGLTFGGQLTAAGQIYHGVMSGFGKSTEGGEVKFPNSAGTATSMFQSPNWIDSTNSNFRQLASQLWGGNVQSAEFGIPKQNPIAVPDYVRDNPATPSTKDDDLNYAYQLIQPTVSTGATNYNATIETQKFAYKAGLTINVTTGSTPSYTLTTYQRDAGGNILYDTSGNPKTTTLTYTGSSTFVTLEKSDKDGSGNPTAGLYDARRAAYISLAKVDMGKLATAIANSSGTKTSDWNNVAANTPSNWWNGIVYVQFSSAAPRSTDGVQVPVDGWGVQLTNGATIPNPAFAQTNGVYGTSLATNNPVYVLGNYNADGSSATGTGGGPDSTANPEPPAAIAGDSITVLSTSWTNANSAKSLSTRAASSFTEVSAAFLTGLVPSDKTDNNSYSGGVENFPRFLEDWSSKTFRYRGSMVSLFESEVAKQPWGSGSVYNPPTRDWSFATQFGTGSYPPGTPNSRTYRRISYVEMSKSQWDSELAAVKTQQGWN